MPIEPEERWEYFRDEVDRVLGLLADEPPDQIAYVRRYGVSCDELVLQFDDVANFVYAVGVKQRLVDEDHVALRRVSDAIDQLDGDAWTGDALRTASAWQDLRVIAREVRTELGNAWY